MAREERIVYLHTNSCSASVAFLAYSAKAKERPGEAKTAPRKAGAGAWRWHSLMDLTALMGRTLKPPSLVLGRATGGRLATWKLSRS